jgi:hypothetical protein
MGRCEWRFENCAILNRHPKPLLEYSASMARSVTLLSTYVAQRGLYARVAKQLGMDASYVSRVANGKRECKKISMAIEAELEKMHASSGMIDKPFSKKSALPPSKKIRTAAD